MGQNNILFKSTGNLAKDIRECKITSCQVVSAHIEQMETQNKTYNAIVLLNKENALEKAHQADSALATGEIWGKLHGIPITIKDNFKTKAPSKSYGNFSIYNNPLLVNNENVHYYMATQAYTTPFTSTESPVLSMPIALSKASLPIGIQVVGKRYEDFKLLGIGKVIDEYSDKFIFPLQK